MLLRMEKTQMGDHDSDDHDWAEDMTPGHAGCFDCTRCGRRGYLIDGKIIPKWEPDSISGDDCITRVARDILT